MLSSENAAPTLLRQSPQCRDVANFRTDGQKRGSSINRMKLCSCLVSPGNLKSYEVSIGEEAPQDKSEMRVCVI